MPDQATHSIAVVCEADADRRSACILSDRVLRETVDWITPETIDHLRQYRGIEDHEPYLKWTRAKEIAQRRRIVAHGFVDGAPRKVEAAMAEQALLLLATLTPAPSAVVLTRDADKESRRREGFEQARDARRWPFEVVIGVADTKRECWHLAGYDPRDEAERALLDGERRALGFDPRSSAEQLSASEDGAKRDAKRVLEALTGGDRHREDACLEEPHLDDLKQRGAKTGLTSYLEELEARLVPLFRGS
jgi:hypothetical protein